MPECSVSIKQLTKYVGGTGYYTNISHSTALCYTALNTHTGVLAVGWVGENSPKILACQEFFFLFKNSCKNAKFAVIAGPHLNDNLETKLKL